MFATVQQIADYIEELAPLSLALPGDPAGLQVGDPGTAVDKVLVALDLDEQALRQAVEEKAGLVVTHHPLFFQPMSSLDLSLPRGALIASIIRNKINVYSAHTNLDAAPGGVSSILADVVGLSDKERQVIEVIGADQLLKLVVFVPAGHEDSVRAALAAAGAGWIGAYSHCSFQTRGAGTFMPREGSAPFIGSAGRLEKVDELRLETVLPDSRREAVIAALLDAHPYEETAYDLYSLAREGRSLGFGLIANLEPPLSLDQLLQRCRERLNQPFLRYWAPEKKEFRRVAVCGGNGGSLVELAAMQGAELFISGDFRYHDLQNAVSRGMGLVDAGHHATEQPVVGFLAGYLRDRLSEGRYTTTVVTAGIRPADWRFDQG